LSPPSSEISASSFSSSMTAHKLVASRHRQLYQFQKLGDDDDEKEFSSRDYPSYGMAQPNQPLPRAYFRPRPLENLALADEIESLNPILDAKVLNLLPNSDTPQIFTLSGRGSRSMLRTLRHGLEVEETVSSDLPGIPNAVWTVKVRSDGECCSYRCCRGQGSSLFRGS
jgi:splicing factor 3B subunit 3